MINLPVIFDKNIKASKTVLEAMFRNLLTTIQLCKSADRDTRILLSTCSELQCRYIISHKMVLLEETQIPIDSIGENELIKILLDEFQQIVGKRKITVEPTVVDIMKKLFFEQKHSVKHIHEFVENLKKEVKTNLWDLKCPAKFQVRYKSYLSFLIKMLKKYELRDYMQLNSYYDFIAFKIVLMTQFGSESDCIEYCYQVLNNTITAMAECGYKLIPLKISGKADKRVNPLYADYIKDYIANPKNIFTALLENGKLITATSHEKCKMLESQIGSSLKWKKNKVYQALHFACCKDSNFGEGQVLIDDFYRTMRNHSKFKADTRGEIEGIFDPSQYSLEGFKSGDEISDFFYFKEPKVFCNEIIRPSIQF